MAFVFVFFFDKSKINIFVIAEIVAILRIFNEMGWLFSVVVRWDYFVAWLCVGLCFIVVLRVMVVF